MSSDSLYDVAVGVLYQRQYEYMVDAKGDRNESCERRLIENSVAIATTDEHQLAFATEALKQATLLRSLEMDVEMREKVLATRPTGTASFPVIPPGEAN